MCAKTAWEKSPSKFTARELAEEAALHTPLFLSALIFGGMNVSNRPSAGEEEPPTAANNSQWGNNVKKSERIQKKNAGYKVCKDWQSEYRSLWTISLLLLHCGY